MIGWMWVSELTFLLSMPIIFFVYSTSTLNFFWTVSRITAFRIFTYNKVTSWILGKIVKNDMTLGYGTDFSKILLCSYGEHDVHHVNPWFDLWTSSSTWEQNHFSRLRCRMFKTKLKVKYAPVIKLRKQLLIHQVDPLCAEHTSKEKADCRPN